MVPGEFNFDSYHTYMVGRDSPVVTATSYRLDGTGIESRWGARLSTPDQIDPGAHPAFCTLCTVSFPGGPAAGAWRRPPTPLSRAKVKERVELYLYSSSGPSWPVLGRPLPLPLPDTYMTQISNKIISNFDIKRFTYKTSSVPQHYSHLGLYLPLEALPDMVHVQVDNKVCLCPV
jgi:hypothetical protein